MSGFMAILAEIGDITRRYPSTAAVREKILYHLTNMRDDLLGFTDRLDGDVLDGVKKIPLKSKFKITQWLLRAESRIASYAFNNLKDFTQLTRNLRANLVDGVTELFEKKKIGIEVHNTFMDDLEQIFNPKVFNLDFIKAGFEDFKFKLDDLLGV